jgi:hypothetical protein
LFDSFEKRRLNLHTLQARPSLGGNATNCDLIAIQFVSARKVVPAAENGDRQD